MSGVGVIMGEVFGDRCPKCRESLDLEGEFFEGTEVTCSKGHTSIVAEIEAQYTVYMELVDEEDIDE